MYHVHFVRSPLAIFQSAPKLFVLLDLADNEIYQTGSTTRILPCVVSNFQSLLETKVEKLETRVLRVGARSTPTRSGNVFENLTTRGMGRAYVR